METNSHFDRSRLPKHVAIIMDGNGRWAQRGKAAAIEGHRRGVAERPRRHRRMRRLGIEQLTLYCLVQRELEAAAGRARFPDARCSNST